MRRYLGMQSETGSVDMLKFASSALDVSSKVYGLRVDCVYDASMKLASRINRICAQGDVDIVSDAEGGSICKDADTLNDPKRIKAPEKRKMKLKTQKATIVKDDSELFGNFPQIVISMFNTETHIKNSKTENLLSNRLLFSKSGTTMSLWNEECAFRRSSDIDHLVIQPLAHRSFQVQLLPSTLPAICPQLRSFVLDEWDPEQDLAYNLEEVVYDKDGLPIPEMDATLTHTNLNTDHLYNDSQDEASDNETVTDAMVHNRQGAFVVEMNSDNSNILQVNEYSYLSNVSNVNRQLSQIWAGPSHWKLKTLKRRDARFTGKQNDKQKTKATRRLKKQVENISFDDDTSSIMQTNKKEIKNNRTVVFAETHKLFMPLHKLDVLILDRQLRNCDRTTKWFRRTEHKRKHRESSNNITRMSINDSTDDCPDNDFTVTSNFHSCSHTNVIEAEDDYHSSTNLLPYKLVDKPDIVTLSRISYQTQARKIDIKKLKMIIWNYLTKTEDNTEALQTMRGTVRFRDILKEIPAKLSGKARLELTVQTVFVALLHLCNEHCLELKNSEDVLIRQRTGKRQFN